MTLTKSLRQAVVTFCLVMAALWGNQSFALGESLYQFKVADESSFKKFDKSILDYKPEKYLLDDQKAMVKELKDRYKAKKVDLILLENDKYYYRLLFNKNKVMLCNENGSHTAMPYPTTEFPANAINVIQIEGDDDYYFLTAYDSMTYQNDGFEPAGYSTQTLYGPSGRLLSLDCISALAVDIDGVKYVSCRTKDPLNNSKRYHVATDSNHDLYCTSTTPVLYAPAVTEGTDNIKGSASKDNFNIFRMAHPAYFINSYNIISVPEYKTATHSFETVPLGNSGFIIRNSYSPKTKIEPSVVLHEGNTVSGKKITFNGQYDVSSLLELASLDGNVLLNNATEISISEPDNVAYFTKWDNGNFYVGAVSLQDTTVKIPAKFINAAITKDSDGNYKRLVCLRPFDDMVLYEDNIDFTYEPASEVERDFVWRNYYSCFTRDNYNEKSNDFTVTDLQCKLSSYLINCSQAMVEARKVQEKYLNGIEPVELNDDISPASRAMFDIEIFYDEWRKLEELSERYIAAVPKSKKAEAERLVENCNKVEAEMRNFKSWDLPQAKETYAQIKLKQKLEQEELERQRLLAAEQERLIQQQQQAAFAQAFLAGFANILGNIANAAASPSPSKASKSQYSSVPSAVPAGGGSSYSSSEPKDNTDHKIWVNNKRIDLEKKLDKAYKQLEHATESYNKNPSSTTKNLLESAKKYYEEIQRELRELK